MGTYSIKEVEHLSGVKAHTLRIWEQRYAIVVPKRTETNIRYYTGKDLKHILNVALLNKHGHRIGTIAKMSAQEIREIVASLAESDLRFDLQVMDLTTAMIEMNEARFEKTISTNILQYGFEQTMMKVIYPFLTKIGIMWITENINPAQEHFITNLVRQKIIVAIDGQIVTPTPATKKYLLFLPENEYHELSLLFLSYLLRARNHRVVYLGTNVPMKDVFSVVEQTNPDYAYSIFTCFPASSHLTKYIRKLAQHTPFTKIILSGQRIRNYKGQLPDNVCLLKNDQEILTFIEQQNMMAETEENTASVKHDDRIAPEKS